MNFKVNGQVHSAKFTFIKCMNEPFRCLSIKYRQKDVKPNRKPQTSICFSFVSRLSIYPRVLRNVSSLDLTTTILGTPIKVPIGVSPTGYHKLYHQDGERATAKGRSVSLNNIFQESFLQRQPNVYNAT